MVTCRWMRFFTLSYCISYLARTSFAFVGRGINRLPQNSVLLESNPNGNEGNKDSSVIIDGVPPSNPAIIDRVTDYEGIKGAYFQGFNADGGMFVLTRPHGKDTLQLYSIGAPLGSRRQLTDEKDAVGSVASTPPEAPEQGVLFSMSKGGSEQDQVYFLSAVEGASPQLITQGKGKTQGTTWSDDGRCIAFSGNEHDGIHFDVYLADAPGGAAKGVHCPYVASDLGVLAGLKSQRIFETNSEGGAHVQDFAGGAMLISEYRSVTSSTLILIKDLSKPTETIQISPAAAGEACRSSGGLLWVQNEAVLGVLYASDEASNFRTLRYFDVELGKSRVLESTAKIPWDFTPVTYSASAGCAVAEANVDGVDQIWLISGEGSSGPTKAEKLSLDSLPPGQINSIQFKDSKTNQGADLGFTSISSAAPPEVYTLHLPAGANLRSESSKHQLTKWTQADGLESFTSVKFISPTIIHFTSFDGRSIPAFVYRPPSRTNERAPVMVVIHGGPESQWRPFWNSLIQFLLLERHTYVIAPNVRGSSGYGKEYVSLDDVTKREDSVKDIGALLDWIQLQEGMDSDHVGVMGGSYGGYMSLASLAHYSDRLRCGVSMVGITDFVTFLERTSDYRRSQRRLEYGDETDPKVRQFLTDVSPRQQVEKIQRPVLLGAGANDPRVPASEMTLMNDALRKEGQETWLVVFKDEGHGWKKKNNRILWKATTVSFLDQYLFSHEWLTSVRNSAALPGLPSLTLLSLILFLCA